MRTGTPTALLASISMRGRNSPILGTMEKCNTAQTSTVTAMPASNSHHRVATKTADTRNKREGLSNAAGLGLRLGACMAILGLPL